MSSSQGEIVANQIARPLGLCLLALVIVIVSLVSDPAKAVLRRDYPSLIRLPTAGALIF
jgi:hypothetical protein